MLLRWCTQYVSEFGKLSSGHRTGKGIFIPIPKKGNGKEWSNYLTFVLLSHASKVMLKILQAKFQQYMNWELPDVQAGSRKGRSSRDQIASICWIIEKAREFQKHTQIYFCFIDYTKVFDCMNHNKLWKNLKRDRNTIPLDLCPEKPVCILRSNSQNWTWSNNWFKIGKGVYQSCILLLCLFNLHAEYITWNSGLDDSQVGFRIARGITNNLRYADNTTLKKETEEEL